MFVIERRRLLSAMLFVLTCAYVPTGALAETVAIVNIGNEPEGVLVKAAMKRHLGAAGHRVETATTSGYVLTLSVMASTTRSGRKSGITGHLMVSSRAWQRLGDKLVSGWCKEERAMVEEFKDLVGTRILFLNSMLAQAPNEESLAEMFSTFADIQIRTASKKVDNLLAPEDKTDILDGPNAIE